MTRTTLLRRTILQFEQILFTDDLTFMISLKLEILRQLAQDDKRPNSLDIVRVELLHQYHLKAFLNLSLNEALPLLSPNSRLNSSINSR